MSFENLGAGAPCYFPYQIKGSKLMFRGPESPRNGAFATYLGGSETYGKFVELPFPDRAEEAGNLASVNFGCVNAGIDVYLNDTGVLAICRQARVTILQIMGAQNLSNRFYSVHPRRNDRFVRSSSLMQSIFSDVEFTDIHFTRHLLTVLKAASDERFQILRDELQQVWQRRMRLLIERIGSPVILLWLANHPPEADLPTVGLGQDPLFVTAAMLEELRPLVTEIVEVEIPGPSDQDGLDGKAYSPLEAPAAKAMPGPAAHAEIARKLTHALQQIE